MVDDFLLVKVNPLFAFIEKALVEANAAAPMASESESLLNMIDLFLDYIVDLTLKQSNGITSVNCFLRSSG